MTNVSRRKGILPRRHCVRVSNPAISAVDDDLAAARLGNHVFGSILCFGLGVVVRTGPTRVRFLDIPSASRIRHYVPFISPRHDANPFPDVSS
jgi:hypothetical protein